MAISRVKSRVQFQGRAKRSGKNNKHHPAKPKAKQTNNDAHGPTKAPKEYMFSVRSDDWISDDNSNPVDEDTASFLEKRVLTTDDQEASLVADNPDAAGINADEHDHDSNGACGSDHQTGPNDSCVPSVPGGLDTADDTTDEDCDPPNSLLMQAPLWSWPAEWFPADSFPVAPETTTKSSSEVENDTADPSSVAADATVGPSRAAEETTIDSLPVAEETTADPSPVAEESTVVSSSVAAETISDLSSVSADTISDLSPKLADVTADPSSAAAVTTTGLHPAAAVTIVDPTPLAATPTVTSVPVVVESTAAPSLGPWHQWVVNIFAGCKSGKTKFNKPNNPPQSAPEQPVSIISWTRERSDSSPEITPPPLPRLELPEALAETRKKKNRLTNRPGYAVEIPQAPYNEYIGRAVMEGDADDARAVQRGFRVGNRLHLAPLAQRRNNSASSLLDRDGDTWAEWNKLNITADAMPFTKPQSDSNLLHPQTGARMTRNTSMYSAEQTKGQTGHSFLEDAGHRYPFGGLGL